MMGVSLSNPGSDLSVHPWLSCSRQLCVYMFFDSSHVRFKRFLEITEQEKTGVSATINEVIETELCNIQP